MSLSDEQTLLIVLWLVYMADCILWQRKQSLAFVSRWYGEYHLSTANGFANGDGGGLLLLNPLPPFGTTFLTHQMTVSMSPVGICSLSLRAPPESIIEPPRSVRSLRFEEIHSVDTDARFLVLNETLFAPCGGPQQAIVLADLVKRLCQEQPAQRERTICQFFDAQFDIEEAQKKLSQIHSLIGPIRLYALIFFVVLYLVIPAMVTWNGLAPLIVPILLIVASFAIRISTLYFFAHRALFPKLSHERVINIAKMILCPPAAIRAGDSVTVEALSNYHPILLASVLLKSSRQTVLRSILRDLKHPIQNTMATARDEEILVWFNKAEMNACTTYLSKHGYDVGEMLAAPTRDKDCDVYCPRCASQFTDKASICPDCSVDLTPFATTLERGAL